jgi:hypothetical protein
MHLGSPANPRQRKFIYFYTYFILFFVKYEVPPASPPKAEAEQNDLWRIDLLSGYTRRLIGVILCLQTYKLAPCIRIVVALSLVI